MTLIQGKFLASVTLIAMSFLASALCATKITNKFISLRHATQLIENYYTYGSSSFVFGTCDHRPAGWKRSCSFALQTKKSADSLDHVKICNFNIEANVTNGFIGDFLEVHNFGNDKAILTYRGKHGFIRFAVLNFSNCTATVSKIDDDLHLESGIVLANDDKLFDIVERKHGKSCAQFAFNKMILDDEANIVTELNEWLCSEKPLIIAGMRSPLKGHLIVDAASTLQKNVRLIEINQNVTVLKEFFNNESLASTVAISNTQKKLSICYKINLLRFNCSQYDHNGGLQFETSFEFQRPTKSINLYNLPRGEFLLLAQENINDDKFVFSKTRPNNLVVIKINRKGELLQITELPEEFDHTMDFKKIHFHVSENNEYCFSYTLDGTFTEQTDKLVRLSVTCLDNGGLI